MVTKSEVTKERDRFVILLICTLFFLVIFFPIGIIFGIFAFIALIDWGRKMTELQKQTA